MDFLIYFLDVFSPINLLFLILGTVGGLLLGATPGLSPTMAIALLIPFTFKMSPTSGLILLGATYTSTVAGGAVSAILLKIPGAPANIATTLDGHPMAAKGKAREALHYCFISSCLGGLAGMVILVFFTPILAQWALKFGFSQLFWIAILGVTVIGSIGNKSLLMGLISGVIGLWLSTIGSDEVFGVDRYVFTSHIEAGIHIIPALIGLFAIPQVLDLLISTKNSSADEYKMETRSVFNSFIYNIKRVKALLMGSICGIIVGLIPGAGGQIAGLVSYDQMKKTSKNPDEFGKGNPDGVIAAESANNAMVGPSLVPLLTLSIPGSPTAAVLLGGLLIHGIFPGPNLFTQHAAITWTFIDSLIVGQILMLVFGLYISGLSRFVMKIKSNYMAAAVTVLAIFGSYSVQNNFSDVLVMLCLGTAMFFMQKVGFSPAPLVLGLILGPIAEKNFLQGKIIAETQNGIFHYFFTGTLNTILILLCLVSIFYSAYSEYKKFRKIH